MATKRKSGVKRNPSGGPARSRIVRVVEGSEHAAAPFLSVPVPAEGLSRSADGPAPAHPPVDDPPEEPGNPGVPDPELYTRMRLLEAAQRLVIDFHSKRLGAEMSQRRRLDLAQAGAEELPPVLPMPEITAYVECLSLVERSLGGLVWYAEDHMEFGKAVAFLFLGPDENRMEG